ncbi:universal stress protein [Halovenus sp. WSH3]|uniref:Universal stress protein n=1 Tax=Halovenus carboxidivorans TaxID=2692199 RepID=A0A6B0T1C9_9EURY|nr:universal stress protein [Halovenus carboxidivorans]MXR50977.1 universal stress protein [Halovenus carboxidivorans]
MSILVAYDGSDQSEYALQTAVDSFPDQPLLLVYVVKPVGNYTDAAGYTRAQYRQEFDRAESMLETASESIPADRPVEHVVRHGRPAHEILRVAADRGVDHVVVGSRGRDGAKRLLLGSVAEAVARRASVPVTVVRHPPAGGSPERVLVPFDGSDPATAALEYALGQYPDAEITVVYAVYPPPEVTGADDDPVSGSLENWVDRLDEHTTDLLEQAESRAARPIDVETVSGDPAPAIVDYAETAAVDHIVIGSHGRDGLSRLIMGSVAETVVRRAPTSVTVVRESDD